MEKSGFERFHLILFSDDKYIFGWMLDACVYIYMCMSVCVKLWCVQFQHSSHHSLDGGIDPLMKNRSFQPLFFNSAFLQLPNEIQFPKWQISI